MAFMVKDGFRLYYEDTGGVGPTVLFLHGAGGNHLSWWQQVPMFAEEYRCVTMDQRGFGQSPDLAGGAGPAALSTDALVDAAGHSTYFERPDVFNREVGVFLKEHRP